MGPDLQERGSRGGVFIKGQIVSKCLFGVFDFFQKKEERQVDLNFHKGQLISKCPFGIIVWTKIPTKLFLDFCPEFFCSFLGASWGLSM